MCYGNGPAVQASTWAACARSDFCGQPLNFGSLCAASASRAQLLRSRSLFPHSSFYTAAQTAGTVRAPRTCPWTYVGGRRRLQPMFAVTKVKDDTSCDARLYSGLLTEAHVQPVETGGGHWGLWFWLFFISKVILLYLADGQLLRWPSLALIVSIESMLLAKKRHTLQVRGRLRSEARRVRRSQMLFVEDGALLPCCNARRGLRTRFGVAGCLDLCTWAVCFKVMCGNMDVQEIRFKDI